MIPFDRATNATIRRQLKYACFLSHQVAPIDVAHSSLLSSSNYRAHEACSTCVATVSIIAVASRARSASRRRRRGRRIGDAASESARPRQSLFVWSWRMALPARSLARGPQRRRLRARTKTMARVVIEFFCEDVVKNLLFVRAAERRNRRKGPNRRFFPRLRTVRVCALTRR
jgi:hypothetical protein